MFRYQTIFVCLLLTATPSYGHAFADAPPSMSAKEMAGFSHGDHVAKRPFDITGQVVAVFKNTFYVLEDGTGRVLVRSYHSPAVRTGDVVAIRGIATISDDKYDMLRADSCRILDRRPVRSPTSTSLEDIRMDRHTLASLSIEGDVVNAFPDDIDRDWYFVVLRNGRSTAYVAVPNTGDNRRVINGLIGSVIRVSGICLRNMGGRRRFIGTLLMAESTRDIKIIRPASSDPFDVPELESLTAGEYENILQLGRRRISGTVLATWKDVNLLLRADDGRILRVELSAGSPPPVYGQHVMTVGIPETDFFHVNLTEATLKETPPQRGPSDNGLVISGDEFFADCANVRSRRLDYLGKTLSFKGIVRNVRSATPSESYFDIECSGGLVRVDTSSIFPRIPALSIGSTVATSGTFLLEVENWKPNAPFPRITGFFLVARTPEDIRLIASPPWWTPGRLFAVIAALLVALVFISAWNRMLRHLVNHRSRELFREQIGRASAQLRVDERTRLAAELHDSLSQNLSGIACQLNAAKMTLEGNPETRDLLQTTERMLQSCRTELTRCIWDLRGDTLEEPDFTTAIRKNLSSLALPTKIQTRFNVPRARISDSTAHAILCIIRELVTNAVRHGKSAEVKVAGSVENDRLLFSVRDNGRGFDTAHHPGVVEGHFGLEGIRDRVNRLHGDLEILSQPGKGTDVRVSLPLIIHVENKASVK